MALLDIVLGFFRLLCLPGQEKQEHQPQQQQQRWQPQAQPQQRWQEQHHQRWTEQHQQKCLPPVPVPNRQYQATAPPRVVPVLPRQYSSIAPPRPVAYLPPSPLPQAVPASPQPIPVSWSPQPPKVPASPQRLPRPVSAKPAVVAVVAPSGPQDEEDELFKALRARANAEGDAMREAFEARTRARKLGLHARANELSDKAKRHREEMNRLHGEASKASKAIFVENNKGRSPGEVDLHGLYVKEAEQFAKQAIEDAKARGDLQVSFIVGKGLHSKDGSAKIKPAIEKLMIKCNLVAEVDPSNAGVLLVRLGGLEHGAGRAVRSKNRANRKRGKRQRASGPPIYVLDEV